jgi:hypothetical protein
MANLERKKKKQRTPRDLEGGGKMVWGIAAAG